MNRLESERMTCHLCGAAINDETLHKTWHKEIMEEMLEGAKLLTSMAEIIKDNFAEDSVLSSMAHTVDALLIRVKNLELK